MADIILAREEQVFVVPEPSWGQLAYPSAGDLVLVAGNAALNQNLNYVESEEIRNSRSLLHRFRTKTPAGNWSFPTYIRPAGAAGSPPMGGILFEALLGKKDTGTSAVSYTPSLKLPSFSLWVKKGDVVFFADGCVVNEARLTVAANGVPTIDWSGNFRRMGKCGVDSLASSATAGATSIEVTDGEKFDVGAKIIIGGDDNGGQGYTITAISGNTLTIDPGLSADASAGAEVKPWLPDASSVSFGDPLESESFAVLFGTDSKLVRNIELTIANNIRIVDDELTGDLYPTGKIEGERRINGRIAMYLRPDEVPMFTEAYAGKERAVTITGGESTGSKIRIEMPRVQLEVPTVGTDGPAATIEINYTALGTTGEDEIQIIFE